MRISTVIVTKNRVSLLKKAVISVFNQSDSVDKIVIVDDASTDDTWAYLQSLEREFDGFVQSVRNCNSLGGARSRNIGISLATGDYVAFLDDDDTWDISKISEQKKILENGFDLVYTGSTIVGKDGEVIGQRYHTNILPFAFEIAIRNTIGITSTVVIRKSLLDKHGFDESLPALQDYELFIRLVRSGARVGSVPLFLVNYLRIPGSVTVSSSAPNFFTAISIIIKRHGKGWFLPFHLFGALYIFFHKFFTAPNFRHQLKETIFRKK